MNRFYSVYQLIEQHLLLLLFGWIFLLSFFFSILFLFFHQNYYYFYFSFQNSHSMNGKRKKEKERKKNSLLFCYYLKTETTEGKWLNTLDNPSPFSLSFCTFFCLQSIFGEKSKIVHRLHWISPDGVRVNMAKLQVYKWKLLSKQTQFTKEMFKNFNSNCFSLIK